MGKTTNILDLNNRLTKVEKENVAQNNYNSLKNRPKINGNLLTGDKTGIQLGLQDELTFDSAPTASSNNPVKSSGIKTYVDNAVSGIENIKVANVSATMTVSTADNLAIGGHRSESNTSKSLSSFTGYPTGKTVVAESLYAWGANAAILGVVHVINGTVYLNAAATGDYTVHGVVFYKD